MVLWLASLSGAGAEPKLEVVASFPHQQVTGVGVSQKSGRVFVNFPRWSDAYEFAVGEVLPNGTVKEYPDAAWNAKDGDPAKRFVCVQSVVADNAGHLWVLDPASPKFAGVVPGGAKLVEIDLATNQVMRVYPFDGAVAPQKSYLNDVRIDAAHRAAYLTESGIGSLIVLDLDSGHARALLRDSKLTKAESGINFVIDGIHLIDPATGQAPAFHADGLAFDAKRGVVYFHALTGHSLYRVPAKDLRDASLSEDALAAKVERVATTPMPDGMLESPDGTLLLTDLEDNAVVRCDPKTGRLTTVVKDDRLQWPDTLAWGPDGWLYVTASQIHRAAMFNAGVSRQLGPYQVFRVHLPGD
ncbi:MAG: L-dopachrome tautomerase-related protein [Verrucomicrobiota bacterium]